MQRNACVITTAISQAYNSCTALQSEGAQGMSLLETSSFRGSGSIGLLPHVRSNKEL